jgi:hypothetical protein
VAWGRCEPSTEEKRLAEVGMAAHAAEEGLSTWFVVGAEERGGWQETFDVKVCVDAGCVNLMDGCWKKEKT